VTALAASHMVGVVYYGPDLLFFAPPSLKSWLRHCGNGCQVLAIWESVDPTHYFYFVLDSCVRAEMFRERKREIDIRDGDNLCNLPSFFNDFFSNL